jgi:hypothetical protein
LNQKFLKELDIYQIAFIEYDNAKQQPFYFNQKIRVLKCQRFSPFIITRNKGNRLHFAAQKN